MKSVGIFEAKTHFPALCAGVAASGTPVLVSKRGRPLVVISPVREGLAGERADIHTAWRTWKAEHREGKGEFPEVWRHRRRSKTNPLSD